MLGRENVSILYRGLIQSLCICLTLLSTHQVGLGTFLNNPIFGASTIDTFLQCTISSQNKGSVSISFEAISKSDHSGTNYIYSFIGGDHG